MSAPRETKVDPFTKLADELTCGDTEDTLSRGSHYREQLKEFYGRAEPKETKGTVSCLDDLLTGNFIVGESHDCLSSKQFLIENMHNLKMAGFTTLFLEHLYYEDQKALNEYCGRTTSITSPMPESTFECLNTLDQTHMAKHRLGPQLPFSFKDVVLAAKMAGIRVVGIDTEYEYKTYSAVKGALSESGLNTRRQESMNYVATKIIEKEMEAKPTEKWVALMGESHIKMQSDVLGVSELTGARTVHVQDEKELMIRCNTPVVIRTHLAKDLIIPVDVYIGNDPFNDQPRKAPQFHRMAILKELLIYNKHLIANSKSGSTEYRQLHALILLMNSGAPLEKLIPACRELRKFLIAAKTGTPAAKLDFILDNQFKQWISQNKVSTSSLDMAVEKDSAKTAVIHKP